MRTSTLVAILRVSLKWVLLALLASLMGCGQIITTNEPGSPNGHERRLYVNDAAANDSLDPAIIESGVRLSCNHLNLMPLRC